MLDQPTTEKLPIRDRIGVDCGRKLSVEDAVEWAVANEVTYIDCQIDIAPNALKSFDAARCEPIKQRCAETGVQLGLHTLSAVNVAEYSPFLDEAVDEYLKAYIDACALLDAKWIVVHAGYHFTDDVQERMDAGLERLKRITGYAEEKGAQLLLENTNWEPDRAEVHYLVHNLEETNWYFDRLKSPNLGWSFTINHATLVPEGIAGFVEGGPSDRLGEVRMADNNGEYELHMKPGTGIIDWTDMFRRIEATGFNGHYMNAFGSLDDMLEGREWQVTQYPSDAT
ncbi:MAG: sugar phosphate isomerase/epimerase [Paracoccaceae bacterium]